MLLPQNNVMKGNLMKFGGCVDIWKYVKTWVME